MVSGVFSMEFFVNNEKIDVSLENEKTVGEVLIAFEKEFAKNEATTVGIVLNGQSIDAGRVDEIANEPLNDDTKLELTVINALEIESAFNAASADFEKLAGELENVPVLIQSGKEKNVADIVKTTADEIESFVHILSLSSLFPEKYGKIVIGGKSFADFFAEFSPILKDFENALESKDSVLTGDLAEYELAPRIRDISNAIRK